MRGVRDAKSFLDPMRPRTESGRIMPTPNPPLHLGSLKPLTRAVPSFPCKGCSKYFTIVHHRTPFYFAVEDMVPDVLAARL